MPEYASYVRVSTPNQESGESSQIDAVTEWFDERGIENWTTYVDSAMSGADLEREEFDDLIEAVKDDEYDVVVMTEISRLARITYKTSEFIHHALETETRIVLLDEVIDEISQDEPFSKFIANILASIYEQEREQTIRRIKRGKRAAKKAGKWTSRPPAGFRTTDDGYLQPIVTRDEDENGKDTYLDIQEALEAVERGESYYEAAKPLSMTQQSLGRIHKNRRDWYLEGTADDERVAEALEGVQERER